MAYQYRTARSSGIEGSSVSSGFGYQNVRGEITRDEVTQRLKEHYGNHEYIEPRLGLDGGYEILPPDSPKIKEIEEWSRKIRPGLYINTDED